MCGLEFFLVIILLSRIATHTRMLAAEKQRKQRFNQITDELRRYRARQAYLNSLPWVEPDDGLPWAQPINESFWLPAHSDDDIPYVYP